jgi:hypothetical protein
MATSTNIIQIQKGVLVTKELADTDGTAAIDLVAGVADGRRIYRVQIASNNVAPGGTYTLILESYDGTTAAPLAIITLVNTADTIQYNEVFNDLVLPSTAHKLRAKMRTTLATGAKLLFEIRGGDYTA